MGILYLGNKQIGPVLESSRYGATINSFLANPTNGIFKIPEEMFYLSFDGIENISENAGYYKFCNTPVRAISFQNLSILSNDYSACFMFAMCKKLKVVNMNTLTQVTGKCSMAQMFNGCSNLTYIDLGSLNFIGGEYAFYKTFANCKNLIDIEFPALKAESFNIYTNQFDNMLYNIENCTVHFPNNLQSTMINLDSIINGFGGINTTILFDLPPTE